jgi:hypothetical protein
MSDRQQIIHRLVRKAIPLEGEPILRIMPPSARDLVEVQEVPPERLVQWLVARHLVTDEGLPVFVGGEPDLSELDGRLVNRIAEAAMELYKPLDPPRPSA